MCIITSAVCWLPSLDFYRIVKMKEEEKFDRSKLGGGPKGFGDPNDLSLRKVEKDVLIPKIIRDRTKEEKCVPEVNEFKECVVKSGLKFVIKCRKENEKMKMCMKKWYYNDEFVQECTKQYLDERSEYRRTGIPKKQQRMQSSL